MRSNVLLATLLALGAAPVASAQDAVRGAQLYLRLPAGVPSCVGCHGPDPTQGRNNILRAADTPAALQKALNDVGAMGYLKPVLVGTDVVDLAAYLGRVAAMANPQGPVGLWPPTLEFGHLSLGSVSPEHRVVFENRGTAAWRMTAPRVAAGPFTLVHDCPDLLAPAARCEARLRAEPAVRGPSTGVLVWQADAAWSPLLVGLVVEARDEGVAALAAQAPQVRLVFPATPIGSTRTLVRTFVSNGVQPITLGALNVSGPQAGEFAVAGDCTAGRSLPPAATCSVEITHRPVVAVPARAMLQLRGNGTHPPPLELVGEGQAVPPVPEPDPPAGGGRVDGVWLLLIAAAALCLRSPRRRRRTTRSGH